jgi:hypothetical protein
MEFAVEIIQDAPPENDDCSVTRAVVEAVLTQDDCFRARPQSMPLYSLHHLKDLQSRIQSAPVDMWAIVPTPHYRARRRRGQNDNLTTSPDEQVKRRLRERFPHLEELLGMARVNPVSFCLLLN